MLKNSVKKFFLLLLLIFSVSLLPSLVSPVFSDVPNYINYQGRLRYQGQPLSGTRNFVFGIYTQASGGAATWEENEDVKVSTGIYSHSLGSGNLVTGNWSTIDWASIGANCYLSVNVGGSGELLPRMKFEAVPYSFVARQLWDATNNIVTSGGNVGIGTTNPLTELYVVGTTSITSNAWIDGDMNLKGTLKAIGNIGIGTTNPLTNLYVVGTTSITSNAWIDGNLNLKGALKAGGDITGGNVGVGTTNPLTNLYVVGTTSITSNAWIDGNLNVKGNVDMVGGQLGYYKSIVPKNTGNSIFIGEDAGRVDDLTNNYNNFIGYQAGYSNTTGQDNNFIGNLAGYTNSNGVNNNYIGYHAGRYATGNNNNFIGYQAGRRNTGSNNNFFGRDAGRALGSGGYNNFFGNSAGYDNTSGRYNNFFGFQVAYRNTTGSYNHVMGYQAAYYNLSGSKNIVFGYRAGAGESGMSYSSSTIVGAEAGFDCYGSRNTLIGYRAGYTLANGQNNIVISTDETSFPTISDSSKLNIGDTIYGDLAAGNIGIGVVNPTSTFQVNGDMRVMQQHGCAAYRSGSITSSNETITHIIFNNELWDYGDMHDNGTLPARFTIPSDGRYLVNAGAAFEANGTGARTIFINQPYSSSSFLAFHTSYNAGAGSASAIQVTAILELKKGDTIGLSVWQSSGGNLDVLATLESHTYIKFTKLH